MRSPGRHSNHLAGQKLPRPETSTSALLRFTRATRGLANSIRRRIGLRGASRGHGLRASAPRQDQRDDGGGCFEVHFMPAAQQHDRTSSRRRRRFPSEISVFMFARPVPQRASRQPERKAPPAATPKRVSQKLHYGQTMQHPQHHYRHRKAGCNHEAMMTPLSAPRLPGRTSSAGTPKTELLNGPSRNRPAPATAGIVFDGRGIGGQIDARPGPPPAVPGKRALDAAGTRCASHPGYREIQPILRLRGGLQGLPTLSIHCRHFEAQAAHGCSRSRSGFDQRRVRIPRSPARSPDPRSLW